MTNILLLESVTELERSLVGGKAKGLNRMIRGGVNVPPGFVVTTDCYSKFLIENNLASRINSVASSIDYVRTETVKTATLEIRNLILYSDFPIDAKQDIITAYRKLGTENYVAVRSSGTAEDMGDASFAGLYDSYLDIKGEEEVLDAVKRCWASLWTSRCASYRNRLNIPISEATVAVVVQVMVAAKCAGVLFTANPLAERTDQMVVNSNWGLGESIASGIVTPDEFLVNSKKLTISSRILGSKEVQIIRNPNGKGTLKRDVGSKEREIFSLSDNEVSELCRQGIKILALSNDKPQDIEWAFVDGVFYLLQSRDITGANFLWEEDIDSWQTAPDYEDETWSHTWAKAYWTGAVSPLFYSVRGRELRNSDVRLFTIWGFKELINRRRFKFRRSTVYFSSDADRIYYRLVLPVRLRKHSMGNLPPDWREAAAKSRFSWYRFVKMHLRVRFLTKDQGPIRSLKSVRKFFEDNTPVASKPLPYELRTYSDDDLRKEISFKMQMFEDYFVILRPAFHIYSATAFALLNEMLDSWYHGDNEYAFQDLISGLPERTAMLQEQLDLYEVSNLIRQSSELNSLLFSADNGEEFFSKASSVQGGSNFHSKYKEFLSTHGHRGHQDRDFWFPRRIEDPQIDFQSLRALITANGSSPEVNEHKLVEKRLESTEEVLRQIKRGPFGFIKAKLFRTVLNYVHRFLVLRDDERPFADLVTMSKKRNFYELGRRLHERGLIKNWDDFLFLSEYELYDLWDGTTNSALIDLKITGRRHIFEKFLARDEIPTDYLTGNTPLFIDDGSGGDGSGKFQGVGMSRGQITGTARIIRDLREMEKVQKGEILICNSTDPGWTPVFGLISGLVLESGGMLSHGACLSREYGLPAVNLPNAMQKVPDGATITLNGDTGLLVVHQNLDVN